MAEADCIPKGAPALGRAPSSLLDPESNRRLDVAVALLLTLLIVSFHIIRAIKGGGLWRDEAASAHLATACSIKEVISNSQHELFPALFPEMLRVYCWIGGRSDAAMRIFGMFVGISILAALWLNMWLIRRGVPLLSLALLGFNGAFIQWGDAIRGYGLGILFILLTVGLLWRVTEQPDARRIVAAAAAAIGSVQCLFNNSVLLLSISLGAMAVTTMRRGQSRQTLIVLGIGIAAALSLLPYLGPLRHVREWDMLVRSAAGSGSLWLKLNEALSASGWWNSWIWLLLCVAGLLVLIHAILKSYSQKAKLRHRHLFLFCGVAVIASIGIYLGFLGAVGYPTQPWYYLALMAVVATCLDALFDSLQRHRWARISRIAVAVAIAVFSFLPTLRQVQVRQSNVDLVAAKIHQLAAKEDLIIVSPWYVGVSFNRYHAGPQVWMTVPPIDSHKVHRYDLIKSQMTLPDQNEPVRPLLENIAKTLKAGHRVWVAGEVRLFAPGETVPSLDPAPDKTWGWQDEAYTIMWAGKTTANLQFSSQHMQVIPLGFSGPVNRFENLELRVFEGWSGL
jgi:hypothetical protein